MKPLYCFRVNPNTGEITKIVIPEYTEVRNQYTPRIIYKFTNCINKEGKIYRIVDNKINRFVGMKVFTFNENTDNAYKIIKDTLANKINKLDSELKNTKNVLTRIETENKER